MRPARRLCFLKAFKAVLLGCTLLLSSPVSAEVDFTPEVQAAKRLCERINPNWINAVIAAEDHNFLDRPRAASGITVSASRLLLAQAYRNQPNAKRNAARIATTLWLSTQGTHAEMVCILLQHAPFGRGATGHDTAARVYFQNGANDLTLAEIATLVGFLRSPTRFSSTAELALARRDIVLHDMARLNMINESTLQDALAEPLTLPR